MKCGTYMTRSCERLYCQRNCGMIISSVLHYFIISCTEQIDQVHAAQLVTHDWKIERNARGSNITLLTH